MSALAPILAGLALLGGALYALRRAGAGSAWLAATAAAGIAAAAAYGLTGRPALPDQPFDDRLADLSARDPLSLSPAEALARLERIAREQPADPEPRYFIGEFLAERGRYEDAVRAYQAALRRDQGFVPAMIGLADTLTRANNGVFTPQIAEIYGAAYRVDPSRFDAGLLAGLSYWRLGDAEAAEAAWDAVLQGLPEDDPRRGEAEALIDQAKARPVER